MKALIRWLLLTLCFFLIQCSRKQNPVVSDEVGNGGDPVAKIFEGASAKAIRMLTLVTTLEDQDFPTPLPANVREIQTFYSLHRLELIDNIRGLPPFRWVKSNPNGACGHTESREKAVVSLSYPDCAKKIHTETDAAVQVARESVHQVKRDPSDVITALFGYGFERAFHRKIGLTGEALDRRMLFEQGRRYAAEILLRINGADLPSHFQGHVDLALWNRFAANKASISAKIQATEHGWVDEIPPKPLAHEKCVRKSPLNPNAIQLSYTGCDRSIQRPLQAAYILIALESGLNMANAVLAAWANKGHPEDPHWLHRASVLSREVLSQWPMAWNGSEVFFWEPPTVDYPDNPQRASFWAYNPRSNSWRRFQSENNYSQWFARETIPTGQTLRVDHSPVWAGRKLMALTECYREKRTRGAGQFYDPQTNRVELISSKNAPNRFNFKLVPVGDKLLVWGGTLCSEPGSFDEFLDKIAVYRPTTPDGALYDPKTNSWSTIPENSQFDGLSNYSVTIAGDKLLLWGGCNYGWHLTGCSNEGAMYDFHKRQWTPLPSQGSPSARGFHDAFWTGKYLVIYGGFQAFRFEPEQRAFRQLHWILPGPHEQVGRNQMVLDYADCPQCALGGGRFNLAENRWESMSERNFPKSYIYNRKFRTASVWNRRYLVTAGRSFSLYNPQLDEWTSLERAVLPEGHWQQMIWTDTELLLMNGNSGNMGLYF